MAERTPSENGNGDNPETIIEMAPIQPEQSRGSNLEHEGSFLARDLNEIGSTVCLARTVMIVSFIILVYLIVLIILYFTGVIDVC